MQVYERHIEEVKRTIPPDRLLVFNVSEGWGAKRSSTCRREPVRPGVGREEKREESSGFFSFLVGWAFFSFRFFLLSLIRPQNRCASF